MKAVATVAKALVAIAGIAGVVLLNLHHQPDDAFGVFMTMAIALWLL